MQFLSYLLYFLSAVIFISGLVSVSKEQKKWVDKPADWHFKRNEMIKTFSFIGALFFIGGCWASPAEVHIPIATAPITIQPTVADTTNNVKTDNINFGSNWIYKQDEDPMTNVTDYYATIESPSILQLKSPYDGGVTASIVVRHQNRHNSVYLTIDKGQFMPAVDGEEIRVKFDDGKPMIFDCSEPSDGSDNTLFITEANRFIAKLKRSKRLMVQALFYDNGRQTMEFGIQDLKWTH